jgi:hypothetical protein
MLPSDNPASRGEPAEPACSESRQCTEVNRDGDRCHAKALAGGSMCFFHDPASSQKRADAARRGGEKNRAAVLPPETHDFPLNSAGDASALLSRTVNQVLRGEIDPKVANAVGYLITVQIKALEVGKVEQRLAALESIVKPNKTAEILHDLEDQIKTWYPTRKSAWNKSKQL